MRWYFIFSKQNKPACFFDELNCILPWSTAVVICLGFNLSEGKGLGPYIQSGQIQGRQQLTSPTLAEPRHFFGKSETYALDRNFSDKNNKPGFPVLFFRKSQLWPQNRHFWRPNYANLCSKIATISPNISPKSPLFAKFCNKIATFRQIWAWILAKEVQFQVILDHNCPILDTKFFGEN